MRDTRYGNTRTSAVIVPLINAYATERRERRNNSFAPLWCNTRTVPKLDVQVTADRRPNGQMRQCNVRFVTVQRVPTVAAWMCVPHAYDDVPIIDFVDVVRDVLQRRKWIVRADDFRAIAENRRFSGLILHEDLGGYFRRCVLRIEAVRARCGIRRFRRRRIPL